MAFEVLKILKGLVVKEENTLTPKQIAVTPGGTASTTTTVTSSQTTNKTLTLPDITGTLATTSGSQAITDKTIDADLNTITNIENADIKSGAAIDATKIADGSVTSTEFQYVGGVTSDIQTQLNGKEPSIGVLAISKGGTNSGTALSDNRVIQSSAGAIVEAAAITASRALESDANGIPVHSAVTSTELGYVSGVTSAIQTQIGGKADTALSNLASVAINTGLLPGTTDSIDLGSSTKRWNNVHINNTIKNNAGTTIIDIGGNAINDASGGASVRPNTRFLIDGAGTSSIDYGNRILKNSSNTSVLDYSGTNIDVTTRKIVNVVNPTAAQDAATKDYVDSVAATSPSGAVTMFAGASAPAGWFFCDGSAISRTTYAALFTAIGTTWGVGDGSTTFNIPNTQGVFVRGVGSQTIGPVTYTGTLGTSEGDQFQGHYHDVTSNALRDSTGKANDVGTGLPLGTTGITVTAPITDGTNGTPRYGTETRPGNIQMNYIIKT